MAKDSFGLPSLRRLFCRSMSKRAKHRDCSAVAGLAVVVLVAGALVAAVSAGGGFGGGGFGGKRSLVVAVPLGVAVIGVAVPFWEAVRLFAWPRGLWWPAPAINRPILGGGGGPIISPPDAGSLPGRSPDRGWPAVNPLPGGDRPLGNGPHSEGGPHAGRLPNVDMPAPRRFPPSTCRAPCVHRSR